MQRNHKLSHHLRARNQKLILGGYRYNIHHVKEGVKTWRCVCAKKLTGARSWCKGRAETWEGDTKGIPKGEHNHQTEHDLAELEYFKSQLIFAAISDPTEDLNVLIDEATRFLSQGLSFGNRESMKKSLIVARKSAESGELKLGQQPHRSIKGVKRTSVRSKATVSSATLRSSALNKNETQIKNLTQSSSRQKSVSSNRSSTEAFSVSSPLSPNISLENRSNNSSGIGSSFSTSDYCLDNSCFSSMNCNIQQNNWNQHSHFEMPSSSGLTTFVESEPASTINNYGTVNVSMPGEQILAAALFAAAMLGSTQSSHIQQQQYNQHFQEIAANNTFFIPSKKSKGNNNIVTSRATNGTAPIQTFNKITNSFVKNIPAQSSNVKRKGARVNGILQKLSKAAAETCTKNSPILSPELKMSMEIKKEMEDLSKFSSNTVFKKEGKEELENPLLSQERLLINVQTQTDDIDMNGNANEINIGNSFVKNNSDENRKTFLDFDQQQCSPKKLICCCCFDLDETEGLNCDYFPVNCKKRAKLLLEREGYKCKKELSQNESNNNAQEISEMELIQVDNDLKLEIEEDE